MVTVGVGGPIAVAHYTVTSMPGSRTCNWSGGPLRCTVPGLLNGVTYTFTVTAFNSETDGPASRSSTPVRPLGPPSAPREITAVAGHGQVTVSWSPPDLDGGAPVTGYTVTTAPGGKSCSWTTGPFTCTVTGLPAGTQVGVTVVATNVYGNGSPSTPAIPVIPQGAPGAPLGVSAKAGNGDAVVPWKPPASDGGSPITGYTVTALPDGQSCNWTSGLFSCTVTGLPAGTPATFTVVATNAHGPGPISSPSDPVTPTDGLAFHPLSPARIQDSRPAGPIVGPYGTPWGAGQTRDVAVTGAAGVPAGARAVVANVTVTGTTTAGFLSIWPAGTPRPLASSVNWGPRQTVANAVTVMVGATGAVSVFNQAGHADVIIDVVGYYDDEPGAGLTPLTPSRILDSRPSPNSVGPFSTPWGAGTTRQVTVTGAAGVPANADAVVLNATVTGATANGFLTIWPNGQARPRASSLNWAPGQTIPNASTVKVGTGGQVSVFNAVGNANVIFDVVGYFTPGAGHLFHPVNPARMLDTRPPPNQVGPYTTPWPAAVNRDVQISGNGGIPANAAAALLNVTVTDGTNHSFLSIWPAGQAAPLVSSLNWAPGITIPNSVTTKLNAAGAITVRNHAGTTHVIADVAGWYG